MISTDFFAQNGAFRVRRQNTSDAAIQIGYSDYRYLSFGKSNIAPNNGKFAIEHWDDGLNFWVPCPEVNCGNYIMGIIQNTLPLEDRSGLGKVEFNGSELIDGYYVYTQKVNGAIKDSKMFLIGE